MGVEISCEPTLPEEVNRTVLFLEVGGGLPFYPVTASPALLVGVSPAGSEIYGKGGYFPSNFMLF